MGDDIDQESLDEIGRNKKRKCLYLPKHISLIGKQDPVQQRPGRKKNRGKIVKTQITEPVAGIILVIRNLDNEVNKERGKKK